ARDGHGADRERQPEREQRPPARLEQPPRLAGRGDGHARQAREERPAQRRRERDDGVEEAIGGGVASELAGGRQPLEHHHVDPVVEREARHEEPERHRATQPGDAGAGRPPPRAARPPPVIAAESTEPGTGCSDGRPIRSRAVRSTSEGMVRAETTDASPPMPMAATMAASWPRSSARPTIAADDATASVSAARRTTAITRGVWAGARLASRMARVARPKSASAPNGKQKAR